MGFNDESEQDHQAQRGLYFFPRKCPFCGRCGQEVPAVPGVQGVAAPVR